MQLKLRTAWHLVSVPNLPQRLEVELIVDTTAPAVIKAIEEAAAANGIRLERIDLDHGETE